ITFINDPKLTILLPVIYLAWQDDILTKEEFKALNYFINAQDSFTDAEKKFLKSKIDIDTPPGRSELYQWKEMISRALNKPSRPTNLTELGLLIANEERPVYTGEDIIRFMPSFVQLE